MGIEIISKIPAEWVALCRHAVKADGPRQLIVRNRVRLFFDDYRQILTDAVQASTADNKVIEQLLPFIPLVGGANLMKRVANELGRPHYASAALRRIHVGEEPSPEAQEAWDGLAAEMGVDRVLDLAMRLLTPSGRVFLKPRVVALDDGEPEMLLDLFTADMMTVLPHVKRPTHGLVYIHCHSMKNGEPHEYVAIDNKRTFTFLMDGMPEAHDVADHDWGCCPIVDVCKSIRPGQYWNVFDGEDLRAQTVDGMMMGLILKAKAFQQSHIQLAYKGDLEGMPQQQTLHNKSVIYIGGGTDNQLFPIDLQSSPDGLLKMLEQGENTVAGNYGISRDRLNHKGGAGADDGLQERIAEMAQVAYAAEQCLFRVAKPLSREHPKHKIPAGAWSIIDLGYLHNRGDRKTILDIQATEKQQGLKSTYDHVLAENPEYGADRALARAHVIRVAAENAEANEFMKANNTPRDATTDEPGQTAASNGAMGPMVRDGKMSKDAAAMKAMGKKGEPHEMTEHGEA